MNELIKLLRRIILTMLPYNSYKFIPGTMSLYVSEQQIICYIDCKFTDTIYRLFFCG